MSSGRIHWTSCRYSSNRLHIRAGWYWNCFGGWKIWL